MKKTGSSAQARVEQVQLRQRASYKENSSDLDGDGTQQEPVKNGKNILSRSEKTNREGERSQEFDFFVSDRSVIDFLADI